MISSTDAEKVFYKKIQHPFMVKAPRIEELYFDMIKAIYNKTIDNIILNGENLKAFPLESRTREWCPLSLLLFNIVLEFLREIRQEKEIKGTQIVMEEFKLYLLAEEMISYIKDLKDSSRRLLE
jgi:hypothetical protein